MQGPTRNPNVRWLILVVIAALAATRWLAMSSPAHFTTWLPSAWFHGSAYSLTRSALNVACSWLFLVLLPAALLAACYRPEERPGWGLSLGPPVEPGVRKLPPWLIPSLALAGLVFGSVASWMSGDLRSYYPIYQDAGRSALHLGLGEALTIALILATELFYRGAPLLLLERHFGRTAVYLLVPVYTLDHLGATPGELAASALAGLLLGHLALRTRSIWPGVAAHAACAVSVDITSLILNRH
jgi:membrane protease YdiL (CAAX protease family)